LGPWLLDHGRAARSTVDRWRRGQRASGCGGALVGLGHLATLRHGSSPVWMENGGGATVRCLGDGDEAVWRRSSVAAALKIWERKKRGVGGAVRTDGGISLL
jgi:hypothetical protein